ncbi:hypothetical protein ACT4UT_34140, partial [Bacillus sp. B-TM1]
PNANPNTGVLLAALPPNEIYSIVFQVTVNNIPPNNPAPNTASTTYEFTVDPVNPPVSSAATSNTTLLQINNATIISTKTANLTFADVGNTITFTLNLPNTGNVTATDVTIAVLPPLMEPIFTPVDKSAFGMVCPLAVKLFGTKLKLLS